MYFFLKTPSSVPQMVPVALKFGSHRVSFGNNRPSQTVKLQSKRPIGVRLGSERSSSPEASPKTSASPSSGSTNTEGQPTSESKNFLTLSRAGPRPVQTTFLSKEERMELKQRRDSNVEEVPFGLWETLDMEERRTRLKLYNKLRYFVVKDALPAPLSPEWQAAYGCLPVIAKASLEHFFDKHQVPEDDCALIRPFFDTKFITGWQMDDFLKMFGPLSQIGKNLKPIVSHPAFFISVSQQEAQAILQAKPPGAYLFGFDGTYSRYLISFNQNAHISHSYLIKEGETFSLNNIKYSSPLEFIASLPEIFSQPVSSPSYFSEFWWMGSLNSENAEFLMYLRPPGSFLVRYSSVPSCFVIQYISDQEKAEKFLVKSQSSTEYTIENVVEPFPSLQAVVAHFAPFLKDPLYEVL